MRLIVTATRALAPAACALVLWIGGAVAQDTGELEILLEALRANVGLKGDVAVALDSRKKLADLGRRAPDTVVPAVADTLRVAQGSDRAIRQFRLALVGVLEEIGPAAAGAVPLLTEIVLDRDPKREWLRLKARAALAAIGTPEAEQVRRGAARGAMEDWAASATPEDVRRLVEQHAFLIRRELRNPAPRDTLIAPSVESLGDLGPRAESAAETLILAYGDPRLGEGLRRSIATALGALGVEDVDAAAKRVGRAPNTLSGVLGDAESEDPLISQMAMGELSGLGARGESVDALIRALEENRNPGTAARVLGDFGAVASRALPTLIPYVNDPRAAPNVIQALARIGPRDQRVITILRRVARREGHPYRGLAIKALGDIRARGGLPEMTAALSDPEKFVRALAAKAHGKLGRQATSALPVLGALLDDPEPEVRAAAAQALEDIGRALAE